MNGNSVDGVSIIICCYNSAARLPETLRHIARQKVPPHIFWEVIIIDNNSTDDTATIAGREWGNYGIAVPFKIATESKAGLIYAREKGFAEAKFELLLFCDDDNWLEQNYLHYAYKRMLENNNIAILGGRAEGCFELEQPQWFAQFEKSYAIGKPLVRSGIANARSYIAGAGMVIRKSIIQLLYSLKFQPILTGRKGHQLLSGEDSEICLLVLFLGYDLYYDEQLQFVHFMPASRLSWKYCISMLAIGQSIPQVYLDFYRYSYNKIVCNEELFFDKIYATMRRRALNKVIKSFFPLWMSFKIFILPQPGLKKEIEIKSSLNKLKFILVNKKKLQHEFEIICSLLLKIRERSFIKDRSVIL